MGWTSPTICSTLPAKIELYSQWPSRGASISFATNVFAFTKMDEICRLMFAQVQGKLDRKFGCFELFGLDLMLDDALNPVLIEVNTNPAIFTDTAVQRDLVPKLVGDVISMALKLHQPNKLEAEKEVAEFLEKDEARFEILPNGNSAWVGPKPRGLQDL